MSAPRLPKGFSPHCILFMFVFVANCFPSLKVKRPLVAKAFEDVISGMYKELEAQAPKTKL